MQRRFTDKKNTQNLNNYFLFYINFFDILNIKLLSM